MTIEGPAPVRTPAAIQDELATLWRELLHLEDDLGPDSDFFEVGADSLNALELSERIHLRFGCIVLGVELLEESTLRGMAALIAQRRSLLRRSGSLVPLRHPEPPVGVPLLWVPGAGGTVLGLRELASAVDPHHLVAGFDAPGVGGHEPPLGSVEEVAAHHLASLGDSGLVGAFVLGGNSFGGLVAFEMACRLEQAGRPPAALAMVDPFAPGVGGAVLRRERRALRHLWKRWARHVLRRVSPPHRRRFRSAKSQLGAVVATNMEAGLRYRPSGRYGGLVTLVATEHRLSVARDDTLGWSDLVAGEIDVVTVPGSHGRILDGERLPHVAAALDDLLADVDAR